MHIQLEIGNLTAHKKIHLMLLGSPPDMVHGISLRQTNLSTLHCESTQLKQVRVWEFIPAVAECRQRAPLTPRLVRPCYKPVLPKQGYLIFSSAWNR